MRIILPVHHFPPRYSAGAELYTFRLASWLMQHGHNVEVVTIESITGPENGLSASHDTYEGVPVWRLHFRLDTAHRQRWLFDNPLLRTWFQDYLARVQPDLVHFQAGYLMGAGPLEVATAQVPTILTLHDYWFLCPRITLLKGDGSLCDAIPADPAGCAWCMRLESRRFRIPDILTHGMIGHAAQQLSLGDERQFIADRRATLLPALARPDAVIAPSRFLASQFAPYVAPERMHILRYGLDVAAFAAQPHAPTDGTLRLGYLGQIAPHKGVHLLIDAFRSLKNAGHAELHIHGGLQAFPAYVQRLRRQIGDDARIHLHGAFAHPQAPAILSRLDATVVPSTWYENSPLAIMEAHAAGTPVVTSALGGMAELVRDGVDGLHFRPNDAIDLARMIQRLIDEPDLLPQLRAGIHMPRPVEHEMQDVMAIYQSCIQQRSRATAGLPA